MSSARYYGRQLQHRNVQRRAQQWENAEQCAATYGYFQKVGFITNQHRIWEQVDLSGGPRLSQLKEEERCRKLNLRRERLAELFLKESQQYEMELKELQKRESSDGPFRWNMKRLQGVNSELKRREEERRSHEAELRLYHRWRSEQPLLKHVECKNRADFVRKAWVEQIEEKLAEEKLKVEKEEEFEAEQKSRIALQEQAEKAWAEEQRARIAETKNAVQCQIELLRKKELKAKELQEQERLLLRYEDELRNLAKQRQDAAKKQKRIEMGMYFQEQFNLKLKRRAQEVRKALEEDQRLLQEMESHLPQSSLGEEERRDARRQIDRANAVLASYSEIERQIAKDMHAMFQEEARFFWDKQEKRWQEDEAARNRLMADTLATLRLQIQERADKNRATQEVLLQEREDLVQQLEMYNTELEREEAKLRERKSLKNNLDAQVKDQAVTKLAEIRRQEEERQARLEEMRKEEERLLQEFKRLNRAYPSHPLSFGRKSFIP